MNHFIMNHFQFASPANGAPYAIGPDGRPVFNNGVGRYGQHIKSPGSDPLGIGNDVWEAHQIRNEDELQAYLKRVRDRLQAIRRMIDAKRKQIVKMQSAIAHLEAEAKKFTAQSKKFHAMAKRMKDEADKDREAAAELSNCDDDKMKREQDATQKGINAADTLGQAADFDGRAARALAAAAEGKRKLADLEEQLRCLITEEKRVLTLLQRSMITKRGKKMQKKAQRLQHAKVMMDKWKDKKKVVEAKIKTTQSRQSSLRPTVIQSRFNFEQAFALADPATRTLVGKAVEQTLKEEEMGKLFSCFFKLVGFLTHLLLLQRGIFASKPFVGFRDAF